MIFKYNSFTSRNTVYIDDSTQNRIKKAKILFAGCGLGTAIAECAARTGFQKMRFYDADIVEVSNLNRQKFTSSDVGKNKAKSLAKYLLSINPNLDAEVFDENITQDNIDVALNNIDFVVNTIDLDKTYIEIIKRCVSAKVDVFCPFNIGFGSGVVYFKDDTRAIRQLFEGVDFTDPSSFYRNLLKSVKKFSPPRYLVDGFENLMQTGVKDGYFPQLAIGSNIAASIVVANMVKVLSGKKISKAPSVIYIDASEI